MNYEQLVSLTKAYNQDLILDLGAAQLNELIGVQGDFGNEENEETTKYHLLIGITELVGDPASGKTRLALKVLQKAMELNSQVRAILIDTEGTSLLERRPEFSHFLSNQRIMCWYPKSIANMHEILLALMAQCQNDSSIKLIVIDSYAFYARLANLQGKSSLPALWAAHLSNLARKHQLSILATNHVTTTYRDGESIIVPALGKHWCRYVQRRLVMQCTAFGNRLTDAARPKQSGMIVDFDGYEWGL